MNESTIKPLYAQGGGGRGVTGNTTYLGVLQPTDINFMIALPAWSHAFHKWANNGVSYTSRNVLPGLPCPFYKKDRSLTTVEPACNLNDLFVSVMRPLCIKPLLNYKRFLTIRKSGLQEHNGTTISRVWGGGGTPYNGLYGEATPKGVPFSVFRHIKG